MAKLMRSHDWTQTSLGPIETWSPCLKTTLSILLNASTPMFCVWGSDRYLFYNDACALLLHDKLREIAVGDSLRDRVLPGDTVFFPVEQVWATEQPLQILNDGLSCHFPVQEPSPEGGLDMRAIAWSYSPLWDETGAMNGVFASGMQHTPASPESQGAAPALQDPPMKLLANALPLLVAFVDRQQRYQFNNQTYETWFAKPPEFFLGRTVREVLGEAAHREILPYIEQVLAGTPVSFTQELPFKDVGMRYVDVRYEPQVDDQGRVSGYVALIQDVSDRHQAERERVQAETAVRESEARFRWIADSSPIMIWMSAPDGAGIWFNQQWYDFTGQTPDAAMGEGWLAALHPEDAARIDQDCSQAHQNRESVRLEYRLRRQDGSYRWVLDTAVPRFDDQGVYLGYIGSVMDIDDRKQAEAERERLLLELAFERSRFEAVLRQMPAGVLIADAPSGNLTLANEQTHQILRHNYQLDTELEDHDQQVPFHAYRVNGERYEADAYPLVRSLRTGEFITHEEMELRYEDGSQRFLDVNASPILSRDGQIISAVAVFQDITERKRSDDHLRESQHFIHRIAEAAPGILYVYDLIEQRNVYANRQITELLGYTVDQVQEMGENVLSTLLHPDDLKQAPDQFARFQTAEEGVILEWEYRMRHMNGEWRWFSTREVVFSQTDDGAPQCILGISQDITERRQMEERLRQSEARFRLIAEAIQDVFWITDFRVPQVKYVSPAYEKIWGRSPSEIYENYAVWMAAVHPDDRERVMAVASTSQYSSYVEQEYRIVRPDDTVRWIRDRGFAIRNEAGDIEQVVGIAQDITPHKRVEVALRHSEEQARLAIKVGRLGTWRYNLKAQRVELDQRMREIWGESEDVEWVPMVRAIERIHPGDRPQVEAALEAALHPSSTGAYDIDFRIVWDDGSEHWISASGQVQFEGTGTWRQPVEFFGTALDITDRKRTEEALRTAEERLRVALYHTPVTVFNQDCDLRYTWIYKPALHNPETVLGKREDDFLSPEDAATIIALKQRVLDTGEGDRQEVKVTHQGTDYYFDLNVEPLRDSKNQIIGITGASIDISEAKRTAIELQGSEERLRLAMEGAQMATWDVDLLTGQAFWSERHFEMLGYEPTPNGEASEAMWSSRLHPDDVERVTHEWQTARAEHRYYRAEYRVIRASDGELSWMEGLGNFIYDADGNAIRSIGVLFDINDRKQAEASLHEQRMLLETILRQAADAILVCDGTGQLTFANTKARRLAQQPPDETSLNIDLLDWGTAYDAEGNYIPLEDYSISRALRGEATNALEAHMVRQDGSYYDILISAAPLWDPDQQIIGAVATFIDITDRKRAEAALEQRELELRLVTNTVPALVAFVDAEQRYRYNNYRYEEWIGHSAADLYGQHLQEVFDPAAYEEVKPHVEEVLQGQETTFERKLSYKDGSVRDVLVTYVPRFSSQGSVEGFVSLVSDISDRKQAEIALRESEDRLRLALEAARMGTWDWNLATDELLWDAECKAMFGLSPDAEVTIDTFFAAMHPDDRDRMVEVVSNFINSVGGSDYEAEFRAIGIEDQVERWIAAKGQVYFDADGVANRFIGMVMDITDQKYFEHTLKTSEVLARTRAEEVMAIMETTPAAIWIAHDPDCHHMTANQTAYDLMGMESGSVTTATPADGSNPLPFRQFRNGEEIPVEDLPMQKAARTQQEVTDEMEFVFEDGTVRFLYGKAVPLYSTRGVVRGAIGGFVEITALKQSERERERLLQLERQARKDAEEASRIKDEFLAILSHELRSPLNPILGWSTLLRQGKLNAEKTASALETIERNAKLQIQLIDDLLDISRIIRGKLSLNMAPINLSATIRAAIETIHLAAEAKSLQIETQLDTTLGEVLGDSARLQQIVWNLLSNAVKFTPAGGRVTIQLARVTNDEMLAESDSRQTTSPALISAQALAEGAPLLPRSNRYARIRVQDTGKGIAPAFLPHVFEYFRQADSTTTRNFGGLGLGLAIVRYLVELHGGTVHAASPGENQGATFTVYLPLRTDRRSDRPERSAAVSASVEAPLCHLRVLLVDDDPDARDLIAVTLEQEGANVTAVSSAQEAIQAFQQQSFNLLISDIGMPEMDGYMLIEQLRSLPPEQGGEIVAIALTAYAGEINQQRALAAGFHQHIAKPANPIALVEMLANLVPPPAQD